MAASSSSKLKIASSRSSRIMKKKSKSKVEVEVIKVVKQRGLYVEKKVTKSSQQDNGKKSKSPPRRDKNSFLYTALNMLSKPSTATQFPDEDLDKASQSLVDHATEPKARRKPKAKNPSKRDSPKVKASQDAGTTKEVKKKYKSRILNEITDFGKEDDVTVLEAKREMLQTPSLSMYSGANMSRSDVITYPITAPIEKPSQHSDEPKRDFGKDERTDRGLYNFFVDVLENTFSVYNVNVEDQTNKVRQSSSVKFLEIDENVAAKLNIKVDTSEETIEEPMYSEHFYIKDEGIPFRSVDAVPKKKKTKAKSVKAKPETERRVKEKPNKKSDLLNILKEELSQTPVYYEPDNIYEALRQMAKNKRKKLRFESIDTECKFQRRKIIDFKDTKGYNFHEETKPTTNISRPIKKFVTSDRSNHSLKVYDYDNFSVPKETEKLNNVVMLTRHSSDELHRAFNPEVLLRYPESDSGSSLTDGNIKQI